LVFAVLASAQTLVASRSVRSSADATNARSGDSTRVPVLVYHSIARHHAGQTGEQREMDVDTAAFRAQMDYLARQKHRVVSFAALIDELNGHGELPAGAVVITLR
jgi:hypothetical protein